VTTHLQLINIIIIIVIIIIKNHGKPSWKWRTFWCSPLTQIKKALTLVHTFAAVFQQIYEDKI